MLNGKIEVKGKGVFNICESIDEEFPGIDVEFIPNNEHYMSTYPTCPRIAFEYPENGKLRLLIWADKNQEDYTQEIIFDI